MKKVHVELPAVTSVPAQFTDDISLSNSFSESRGAHVSLSLQPPVKSTTDHVASALNSVRRQFTEEKTIMEQVALPSATSTAPSAGAPPNNSSKGPSMAGILQIQRVPIFNDSPSGVGEGEPVATASARNHGNNRSTSPPYPPSSTTVNANPNNSANLTAKPPSSRPKSSKNSGGTLSNAAKQVNLENRILIRLANVLPTDRNQPHSPNSPVLSNVNGPPGAGTGANYATAAGSFKLPESRNALLRLNQDLDEIVLDIRRWGLTGDKFVIGDVIESVDPTVGNHTELPTDSSVVDTIIADLSHQAEKKVSRIKKSFKQQMSRIKANHNNVVSQLKQQVEKLSGQLQELRIAQCTDPTHIDNDLTPEQRPTDDSSNPINPDQVDKNDALFMELDKQELLREELHKFVEERLEIERKVRRSKLF